MSTRKAPYTHADGSNCWTKNCSRGHRSKDVPAKEEFLKEWFTPETKNSVETVNINYEPTYIDVIASQAEFDAAVERKEVTRQRHPDYPYSIYKYSQTTTYNRLWNDVTLASRGLVVNDETGEIVARPFSKFFNYNEPSVPFELMTGNIVVAEKLDGSLGISMMTPDGLKITTAGGFQSEQADHATKLYKEKYEGQWAPVPGRTYMWEIIYPENRIVVDYGDEDDIYLLGAVDIKTGKSIPLSELKEWKWKRAVEYTDYASLDSVVTSPNRSNHEGYVVHYVDTDVRVKYKHDEYLRLHRTATGVNSRRIWEMLRNGDDVNQWTQNVPEEFTKYVETTSAKLITDFETRKKEVTAAYKGFISTLPADINQKDFALKLKESNIASGLSKYFFKFRQQGNTEITGRLAESLWDEIKPEFEKSFWSATSHKTSVDE